MKSRAAFEDWIVENSLQASVLRDWREAIDSAPRAARLGEAIRRAAMASDDRLSSPPHSAPPAWLLEAGPAGASLRLAIAEELASRQQVDACLAWLSAIEGTEVYSPALLHYLRTVASHQRVDDTAASESLARLEEILAERPEGRLGAARLWVVDALRRELADEPDKLASVARRMNDSERRLALADPGEETRRRQQTILDQLDELIDKLEEQRKQQQQQQAASGSGGGAESGNPAEDSLPSELKGPGAVDRKRLVAGDAWGALPPAERERLTQAITRDYPPHYRALVEDYFRTLAEEADRAESKPAPNDR